MSLQKRKASSEEGDPSNHIKRRRTVEETHSSSHEYSKLHATGILPDVAPSEDEFANTESIDAEITQLSKVKKIGDSDSDGQNSSSLNFQEEIHQEPSDAPACLAPSVPAFKPQSESAVSQHDSVKTTIDPELDCYSHFPYSNTKGFGTAPANIADQLEIIQTSVGHGPAKHRDDTATSLTKTTDPSKIQESAKAVFATDTDCITEFPATIEACSKISQINGDSKMPNQLQNVEFELLSKPLAESDTTRPRSDPDQTDVQRLITATEFAKVSTLLSETIFQSDVTNLREARESDEDLENMAPPTFNEVDLPGMSQLSDTCTAERETDVERTVRASQSTILPLSGDSKPVQDAASTAGLPLQKVSEFGVSQAGGNFEHDDVVGGVAICSAISEPHPDKAQDSSNSEPVTNGHVIESTSETPSEQSDDNESVSTKTGPQFQYNRLYRLLRSDENPKENGIKAQRQSATFSVHKHVSEGSSFGTQYISTSAYKDAMLAFATNKKRFPKKIAEIDVRELEKKGNVKFIDLTDESNRETFLQDQRAKNLARKYTEVLVKGEIPAICITTVDTYWKTDFVSDDSDDSIDSDFDYY